VSRTHEPSVRASEDSSCLRPLFLNRRAAAQYRALASIIQGLRLIGKQIYRVAVSQRLRTTALGRAATVIGTRNLNTSKKMLFVTEERFRGAANLVKHGPETVRHRLLGLTNV
jgi:hypothetical protein